MYKVTKQIHIGYISGMYILPVGWLDAAYHFPGINKTLKDALCFESKNTRLSMGEQMQPKDNKRISVP